MNKQETTSNYDPFNTKPLKFRTRRIFGPSGNSVSLTTAVFLVASTATLFYFLVPLEYIRPDIIGWNRTARARRTLEKQEFHLKQ